MGNVHMEATQINYREGNKKMSVAQAIKNAGSEITPEEKTWIDSIPDLTTSNAGKTDQTVIAPEFDAEAGVYAVGDLVMNDCKLYEFTTAHETPGDWDETEVTEKTVADEIVSVKSGLTNKANIVRYDAGGGKTINVNHTGVVIVMSDRGGLYLDGVAGRGVQDLIPSTQITVTNVDANNLTVLNNSQYGTSILVISEGNTTVTAVN